MNYAQFLLQLGMKPRPLVKPDLASPPVQTAPRTTERWDREHGGAVCVPVTVSKTGREQRK